MPVSMRIRPCARTPRRILSSLGALLVLCGCAALVDNYSGRKEACAILAVGAPAQARVLRLIDTGTTINDDPVVEFVLEVMPPGTTPYQARATALVSRLDIPAVQPGRVLPVKFDPRQPSRVAIDLWECP